MKQQPHSANLQSITHSLQFCKLSVKILTNKRSKVVKIVTTIVVVLLFLSNYITKDGFIFPNGLQEIKHLTDVNFEKFADEAEQFVIDSSNGKGDQWITWPECTCGPPIKGRECLPSTLPRDVADIKYEEGGSCSWRAWQLTTPSVISVSAYGVPNNYLDSLDHLIEGARKHYPNWSLWVYTRHAKPKEICKYLKSHPNVFFCDTRHIPALGDLKRTSPFAWKISALGDTRINKVLMKDIDYSPLDREAAAVGEWLSSSTTYHVTRDHPKHVDAILMNQWGATWNKTNELDMRAIRNVLMEKSKSFMKRTQSNDVLLTHLWPEMLSSKSLLIHDSYQCSKNHAGIVKHWPTKRLRNSFVGMSTVNNSRLLPDCPVECRPPNHKDWTKC